MSGGEAYPKAKTAALKALELDPDLSDAHTSLASVINDYDWDWSAAEKEYRRAIELSPNDANAHHWYAMTLASVGRSQEAIAEIGEARRLDPLSIRINANVGWIFYWAREYDQAILEIDKALELNPNDPALHVGLGRTYLQKGMYQEAITELQQGARLAPGNATPLAWLADGYAVTGRTNEALNILANLKKLASQTYISPALIAAIYAGLGEKDQAFALLKKALAEHAVNLTYLKVDPGFDPLRSDPRFAELARKVGLPQ